MAEISDYALQQQRLLRKRRLAEALQASGMEPLPAGGMVGNRFVSTSPLLHLAQVMKSGLGASGIQQAERQEQALGERLTTQRGMELQKIIEALRGRQEPTFEGMTGGLDVQDIPRQQVPNPQAAAESAMGSQFGDVRGMAPGFLGIAAQERRAGEQREFQREESVQRAAERTEAAASQREFLADQRQRDRLQRAAELNQRLRETRISAQERADLQRELATLNADLRREIAGAKPPTEGQGRAAMFGTRAASSDRILAELEGKINVPGLAVKQAVQGTPLIGGMLGAAGNVMLSEDQQRVEQAQRDFLNATLRQESGAVIGPSEFESGKKQYFPQPGDSQKVIEQKRANRQNVIRGFRTMAGPAGTDIDLAMQAVTPNPNIKPIRGAGGYGKREGDKLKLNPDGTYTYTP